MYDHGAFVNSNALHRLQHSEQYLALIINNAIYDYDDWAWHIVGAKVIRSATVCRLGAGRKATVEVRGVRGTRPRSAPPSLQPLKAPARPQQLSGPLASAPVHQT